eukprot:SAG11_NODE_463_length_9226_cov_21.629232_8_plen_251_part_00
MPELIWQMAHAPASSWQLAGTWVRMSPISATSASKAPPSSALKFSERRVPSSALSWPTDSGWSPAPASEEEDEDEADQSRINSTASGGGLRVRQSPASLLLSLARSLSLSSLPSLSFALSLSLLRSPSPSRRSLSLKCVPNISCVALRGPIPSPLTCLSCVVVSPVTTSRQARQLPILPLSPLPPMPPGPRRAAALQAAQLRSVQTSQCVTTAQPRQSTAPKSTSVRVSSKTSCIQQRMNQRPPPPHPHC